MIETNGDGRVYLTENWQPIQWGPEVIRKPFLLESLPPPSRVDPFLAVSKQKTAWSRVSSR